MEDETKNGVIYSGIQKILSGLTGMKALSLYNCTQVNNIDFARYMANLYEIDLRSVSNTLTDLGVLDSSTSLKRLIVNNSEIDATKIQNLINRFTVTNAGTGSTWYSVWNWDCCGYVAENDNFPDFSKCNNITSFSGGNMQFDNEIEGTLDLRGTKVTSFAYPRNVINRVMLPESCSSAVIDSGVKAEVEFSCPSKMSIRLQHGSQSTLEDLMEKKMVDGTLDVRCI